MNFSMTFTFQNVKLSVTRISSKHSWSVLVGFIPPKDMIQAWMEIWEPLDWQCQSTRSLTKALFLFYFHEKSTCEVIASHHPRLFRNTPAFSGWFKDFSAQQSAHLSCPMWVEFPSLPMQFWLFLEYISNHIPQTYYESLV